MSSFYAELEVTGHTYPVRVCQFSFIQATDERGRVRGKVRHSRVHLSLDTPQDDFLLLWGITAHKLLAGHITFFETNQRTARETMSFAAGECVGYHETFDAGDSGAGAYISHLTIVAPKLVLSAGGALKPYVAAAPRGYAAPRAAAVAPAKALASATLRLATIVGDPPFKVKGPSKGKPGLDRAEFARQLAGQQAGLNRLTVAQFIANRDTYEKLRKQKGSGRAKAGDTAQRIAREKAFARKVEELQLANDDLTESEAMDQAQQWMDTQTALHDPDQVAGGHAHNITGMGEKRVNFSIGAQWPKRIKSIDSQVRKQAATMSQQEQENTFLDIVLPLA
jgi:hypothetical protein